MPLYTVSLTGPGCKFLFALLFITIQQRGQAQKDTVTGTLAEVTVKAFEQSRKLRNTPAAVEYIGPGVLSRFGPQSVLNAINSRPGIRMEERSPGSYRFAIRGSSLRSPFGVRNVKVYFNELPFTDPGGVTYLNGLGTAELGTLEVIKGPGSSLYGAGTGGVLLIQNTTRNELPGLYLSLGGSRFGSQNATATWVTEGPRWKTRSALQYGSAEGYRMHSASERSTGSWTGSFRPDSQRLLQLTFITGQLKYETPGALTAAEYQKDPRQARPASAQFPSAAGARAKVEQRSFLVGATYTQTLVPQLLLKTSLYGAYNRLLNPAIQNWGRNSEPHFGGRTLIIFYPAAGSRAWTLQAGAEWQEGLAQYTVSDNRQGTPDSLRSLSAIDTEIFSPFFQAAFEKGGWVLIGGISTNYRKLTIRQLYPAGLNGGRTRFNNWAPRLAVLKNLGQLSLYTSVSRGFSPPVTEELYPTGSTLNLELKPETGTNYEAGIRTLLGKFYADVSGFYFSLDQTIVQRRTAGGGSFFINAGRTSQRGLETYFSYALPPLRKWNSVFWFSHTWHVFHYRNFKQLTVDYSGNRLPGTPEHTLAGGLDIRMPHHWAAFITYYYNSRLPLNDANTAYANSFHLLGLKLRYSFSLRKHLSAECVAGGDNLLNQLYSLGNDMNGFNGRYYNAAAPRTFYLSLQLAWHKKISEQ